MENALSNTGRDELSARGDSRTVNSTVASSSVSLSQAPQPPSSSAHQPVKKDTPMVLNSSSGPTDRDLSSISSSSETNNNLKIFKNANDAPRQPTAGSMKQQQNNGISKDQQQTTTTSLPVTSNNPVPTSDLSGSETNLSDQMHSLNIAKSTISNCHGSDNDDAYSQTTVDTNTIASSDQTHQSESEQQQLEPQQVPSKTTTTTTATKMPANNRSILILREIAPDSPESSVRDIFNSEKCPSKPVHCEYALHNSWYVTFSDDEDAKLALAYIRKHIVKWQGQPIMARYKPKPAVPSAADEPPSLIHHSHHHHHHNPHHPHHPAHHSLPDSQHQIVPTMVMQQQQQQQHQQSQQLYQNGGGIDNTAPPATDSSVAPSPSGFLGALEATPSGGIDGDSSALTSNHAHHHPHQQRPPLVMSPLSGGALFPAPTSHYDPQSHPHHHDHPHHHHHPDGTMLHHPHHLTQQQQHMMGPPQHHHPHHPMATSYNPYYNQHGQLVHAPWDLSSVFIYNGLSPYNKTSVSGVSLVGGAYHHHLPGPQQQHLHHHQAHQHHYYQPPPPPSSHQRHHQNSSSNHSHHHHQRQQQAAAQHHNANTNGGGGGGAHQQMYANNHHHQGTKASRKNNKQNNK